MFFFFYYYSIKERKPCGKKAHLCKKSEWKSWDVISGSGRVRVYQAGFWESAVGKGPSSHAASVYPGWQILAQTYPLWISDLLSVCSDTLDVDFEHLPGQCLAMDRVHVFCFVPPERLDPPALAVPMAPWKVSPHTHRSLTSLLSMCINSAGAFPRASVLRGNSRKWLLIWLTMYRVELEETVWLSVNQRQFCSGLASPWCPARLALRTHGDPQSLGMQPFA